MIKMESPSYYCASYEPRAPGSPEPSPRGPKRLRRGPDEEAKAEAAALFYSPHLQNTWGTATPADTASPGVAKLIKDEPPPYIQGGSPARDLPQPAGSPRGPRDGLPPQQPLPGLGLQHTGYYKYQDNGDTLTDFVSLVCQETQNINSQSSTDSGGPRSPSKLPHFYSSSMLPPPPPAPMARPVAIIRSTGASSPSADHSGRKQVSTPPTSSSTGRQQAHHPGSNNGVGNSPSSSPFNNFAHIHPQAPQQHLFSYSGGGAPGPSLSPPGMFPSPPRPARWNPPFIPLDEEYSMMAGLMADPPAAADTSPHIISPEDRFFSVVQTPGEGGPAQQAPNSPSKSQPS